MFSSCSLLLALCSDASMANTKHYTICIAYRISHIAHHLSSSARKRKTSIDKPSIVIPPPPILFPIISVFFFRKVYISTCTTRFRYKPVSQFTSSFLLFSSFSLLFHKVLSCSNNATCHKRQETAPVENQTKVFVICLPRFYPFYILSSDCNTFT